MKQVKISYSQSMVTFLVGLHGIVVFANSIGRWQYIYWTQENAWVEPAHNSTVENFKHSTRVRSVELTLSSAEQKMINSVQMRPVDGLRPLIDKIFKASEWS